MLVDPWILVRPSCIFIHIYMSSILKQQHNYVYFICPFLQRTWVVVNFTTDLNHSTPHPHTPHSFHTPSHLSHRHTYHTSLLPPVTHIQRHSSHCTMMQLLPFRHLHIPQIRITLHNRWIGKEVGTIQDTPLLTTDPIAIIQLDRK